MCSLFVESTKKVYFQLQKVLEISKKGPGKSLNVWLEKVYEPW